LYISVKDPVIGHDCGQISPDLETQRTEDLPPVSSTGEQEPSVSMLPPNPIHGQEPSVSISDSETNIFEQDLKPSQPMLKKYTLTQFGNQQRSFNCQWYKIYPWLEYNIQRDAAFCHICRVMSVTSRSTSKVEQTFISEGFRKWAKAKERFMRHEDSDFHQECSLKMQSLKSGSNVHSMLNTAANKQRLENLECLKVIFSSIRYLSRQGLALRRGKDE
jgi:hypothetical protein